MKGACTVLKYSALFAILLSLSNNANCRQLRAYTAETTQHIPTQHNSGEEIENPAHAYTYIIGKTCELIWWCNQTDRRLPKRAVNADK